jgi:sodium-coupled neutral amino acid transporter 11
MLFTYPLQLFVFRDTINQAFFTDMPFSYIRHTAITVLTVASTCLLACLTCNVGVLLELVGGVTGSMIALVIPCACWIQVKP